MVKQETRRRRIDKQHASKLLIEIVNIRTGATVHSVTLPPPERDPRTKWIEDFNREYGEIGLQAIAVD